MDYGSKLDARAHPPYDLIWQLPLRRIMIACTMLSSLLSLCPTTHSVLRYHPICNTLSHKTCSRGNPIVGKRVCME